MLLTLCARADHQRNHRVAWAIETTLKNAPLFSLPGKDSEASRASQFLWYYIKVLCIIYIETTLCSYGKQKLQRWWNQMWCLLSFICITFFVRSWLYPNPHIVLRTPFLYKWHSCTDPGVICFLFHHFICMISSIWIAIKKDTKYCVGLSMLKK